MEHPVDPVNTLWATLHDSQLLENIVYPNICLIVTAIRF